MRKKNCVENVFSGKSSVKYGFTSTYVDAEVSEIDIISNVVLRSGYCVLLPNHRLKSLSSNKPLGPLFEYLLHQFKNSNEWELWIYKCLYYLLISLFIHLLVTALIIAICYSPFTIFLFIICVCYFI